MDWINIDIGSSQEINVVGLLARHHRNIFNYQARALHT